MPAESGRDETGGTHRAQLQAGGHAEADRRLYGKSGGGIPGTDAVSYTHLDVYKRQPLHCICGLFCLYPRQPVLPALSLVETACRRCV